MFWAAFWLLYVLNTIDAGDVGSSIRYRYFDDFLSGLDSRDKAFITGENLDEDRQEGSGEIEENEFTEAEKDTKTLFSRPTLIRTGSLRSKETTCCMLGQLAGEKGYHCFAKFYAGRIMFRNYNRAHNKKVVAMNPVYINNPLKTMRKTADKLMRTFEQCVTNWSKIFHKCCHLSAMEKDPMDSRQRSKNKTG